MKLPFETGEIKLKFILTDLLIISLITFFLIFIFHTVRGLSVTGTGPEFVPVPSRLPLYALLSLTRVGVALIFSLFIAIIYGYLAYRFQSLERILIPVLDVFQSIPVLSFMPAVTMIVFSLLGGTRFSLEVSSIILILTGQVWNLIFAFYSSLKTAPPEIFETANAFRLNPLLMFFKVELPITVPSLIYNLMLSSAGGWFFLMACEMLVIGAKIYPLPGLGSFIYFESQSGNLQLVILGFAFMFFIIIFLHFFLWMPLLAWSEKFKLEQVGIPFERESRLYEVLKRSYIFNFLRNLAFSLSEKFYRINLFKGRGLKIPINYILTLSVTLLFLYIFYKIFPLFRSVKIKDIKILLESSLFSFVRVWLSLLLAVCIATPLGVFLGRRRRELRYWDPIVQIGASIPASSLFPVLISLSQKLNYPHEINIYIFLFLSGFWYILFNAMAGASKIPSDFIELVKIHRIKTIPSWKYITLPCLSSDLLTGIITASGGVWNATVVAEYFVFREKVFLVNGIGSLITSSSLGGDTARVFLATLAMATIVLLVNRLIWKRLYRIVHEKFRMEV